MDNPVLQVRLNDLSKLIRDADDMLGTKLALMVEMRDLMRANKDQMPSLHYDRTMKYLDENINFTDRQLQLWKAKLADGEARLEALIKALAQGRERVEEMRKKVA